MCNPLTQRTLLSVFPGTSLSPVSVTGTARIDYRNPGTTLPGRHLRGRHDLTHSLVRSDGTLGTLSRTEPSGRVVGWDPGVGPSRHVIGWDPRDMFSDGTLGWDPRDPCPGGTLVGGRALGTRTRVGPSGPMLGRDPRLVSRAPKSRSVRSKRGHLDGRTRRYP